MTTITLKPHAQGASYRKVTCECKEPFDCDNTLCGTHSIAYLLGKQPANYPVPAIPTCNDLEYLFRCEYLPEF